MESEKIPLILIIVQGEPNTLGTVLRAVENDVPILVLDVPMTYMINISSAII